ncbi:MAG: hypothetical protein KFF50_02745 [Desulfatitalea sp.]|nr:hypothetical protein [Desulfatitalea sp.]
MKKSSWVKMFVGVMWVVTVAVFGWQPVLAADDPHQHGAVNGGSPSTPESQQSTMMPGRGAGMGMGMKGAGGGSGMMGMMGRGPGHGGGQGMMGCSDRSMMHAMMSHMMGGPGGMGRMMGAGEGGMPDPLSGTGGMGRMARLLDDLDLTPDQWNQVRTLARERSIRMVDLWAQRAKLQIELAGMRMDQEIDDRKIKSQFVKIAEIRADEFSIGLEYIRAVKGVLSAEQREKIEARGF